MNFASEKHTENNLKLLADIYERVAVRSDSFLSAEELKKFREIHAQSISGNRMMLAMNRKMMSPGGK